VKKIISALWALSLLLLLTACGAPAEETPVQTGGNTITLSEEGVNWEGEGVSLSYDIIYYEDRDSYDSGHAYGEGEAWEKHTAQEAAAHTVINITEPGTYTVTGTLSKGQIRVDLGETAFDDPKAVVTLILRDVDLTCEVAPAILFLNVYECDNQWEENTPTHLVDTAAAGANLVLEGKNTVSGSHVARIYKDGGNEKKLWKQDGAIYSYMSLNVDGSGSLELTADNEGLDTELHLTINGGDLVIRSDNDGINTNEDGVSVTAINGGSLRILAGLGAEGDGIDSNGWLVINGGTVISSANPASDAGLDSDMGSFINGGTVVALGSTMDWAESDSAQVTMNLQFAARQQAGSTITVTDQAGAAVFSFDPAQDVLLAEAGRTFSGAILSCADFAVGETYQLQINGVMQAYTGTDVQMRPGMGGFGGMNGGQPPEGFDPSQMGGQFPGQMPEGMGGMTPPEGFDPSQMGGQFSGQMPEGFDPNQMGGQFPGQMPGEQQPNPGEGNTLFYMQDKVNNFSGIAAAE